MPRKPTGSFEIRKDAKGRPYYVGRVRLADKSQEWVYPPDGMSEARARDWVAAMQEKELRDGLLLARKRGERDKIAAAGETFAKYAERRGALRLAAGKVNAADEVKIMIKHAGPILADLPIATIGRPLLEDVRDALDAKVRAGVIAWKYAFNIWGYLTSLFSDACESKERSLRVRTDDPTAGMRGPDQGADTQKAYLYPDEFLQLVSCEDVPLRWRRSIAIAVYLYARAGELHALEFDKGVDVQRGVAEITEQIDRKTAKRRENKTKSTRRLPIEAELLPLLEAMSKELGGVGRVMPIEATDRKLALKLQRCLAIAGVTRRALVERTKTAKPLSWHDLRATGITWCAVRGDEPLRIKQRAGHRTFTTTEGYIVEAENIREGFGTVFPPLPPGLLVRDNVRDNYWTEQIRAPENKAKRSVEAPGIEKGARQRSARIPAAFPSAPPPAPPGKATGKCSEAGPSETVSSQTDPVSEALAKAIATAATSGQWDAVTELTAALKDRQRARAGVVDLAAERRRREGSR